MKLSTHVIAFALRLSLGWLFFYAGITKILDPDWSAEGYLRGAETFSSFYAWLASPELLPLVNLVNEWALLLLGVSLLLGVAVRLSSLLGVALMLLYYFPELDFPYVGHGGFLVDEHIIYSLVLILFAATRAGRFWGLEGKIRFLPRWMG
jgi:thiosulfate dehydrogenase (quinone) large subunit